MLCRIFVIVCLTLTTLNLGVLPAKADTAELEKQLRQQEGRIDRLEREVKTLQKRLMDSQQSETTNGDSSQVQDRNTTDPLVGTWECTNNVFNYDISFFDDGRLIQEEPFFSKVKSSNWSRLSENRIVIGQDQTFSAAFWSENELTVTNMTNQTAWDCSRKQ